MIWCITHPSATCCCKISNACASTHEVLFISYLGGFCYVTILKLKQHIKYHKRTLQQNDCDYPLSVKYDEARRIFWPLGERTYSWGEGKHPGFINLNEALSIIRMMLWLMFFVSGYRRIVDFSHVAFRWGLYSTLLWDGIVILFPLLLQQSIQKSDDFPFVTFSWLLFHWKYYFCLQLIATIKLFLFQAKYQTSPCSRFSDVRIFCFSLSYVNWVSLCFGLLVKRL